MQPDDNKPVRLGWIALDVVVDAKGDPISAHVTLHAEKGSTTRAAMVFAQVAEVAQAELHRLVMGDSGEQARHSAVCAMEGDAATCPCQRSISSDSSNCDPGLGAH